MSNLITLTCPSCGGRLEVTNDVDRYVCVHCGNAHLIDPGERAESLAGEIEELKSVSTILRLKDELETLGKRKEEIDLQINHSRQLQDRNDSIVGMTLIIGVCVALAFGAGTVGFAIQQMYRFALGDFIAMSIALGVAWLAWRGRFTIVYGRVPDDTLKEKIKIDRQIAQKQRELERRQFAVSSAMPAAPEVGDTY